MEKNDKEQIFKNFVDDLNFLIEKKHIGIIIPILQIWAEYVVGLLIKEKLGSKLSEDRDFTFSLKLQVLRKIEIITQDEFNTLEALRKSRNELLHNGININEKKFNEFLKKAELNKLDYEGSDNSLCLNTKFFYACTSKIFYLLLKVYNDNSYILTIDSGEYGKAKIEKRV